MHESRLYGNRTFLRTTVISFYAFFVRFLRAYIKYNRNLDDERTRIGIRRS